jgi:hypothetical protein
MKPSTETQQGFELVAPERRTIVVMKFIIELEIGLFFR